MNEAGTSHDPVMLSRMNGPGYGSCMMVELAFVTDTAIASEERKGHLQIMNVVISKPQGVSEKIAALVAFRVLPRQL